MPLLKFHKVAALPGVLEPDAFYFVESGTVAESYVTDDAGNARSIGNTAMIQAVATPIVAAQLAAMNRVEIVADIAARNALAGNDRNQMVLVTNATGDATVAAGAALYVFRNSDNTWVKVAEYEGMDVALTWDSITGKPASAPSLIDAAVAQRHTHDNLAQLNKIGEDGGGALTYNGTAVGGSASWTGAAW
jgi:hypothetical protein